MKGFSFENFEVQEHNQQAYALCRAVASLQDDVHSPLVLLGPEQAGKSHLLWSVVKQVRAGAVKTGLALITAKQFPDKVKTLVEDPSPIQRGAPAILLVDTLEAFQEEAAVLETVVARFIESGHTVVCATNVHPQRLQQFSSAFHALLAEGQLVEIQPRVATEKGETPAPDIQALQEALETVTLERDTLAQQLEALENASPTEEAQPAATVSSDEWEAAQEEINTLRQELETTKSQATEEEGATEQLATLEAELASLRETLTKTEEERDAHLAQSMQLATLERSVATMEEERTTWEEKLKELEGERDALERKVAAKTVALADAAAETEAAFAEQARLQGLLSAKGDLESALETAQTELEEAQAQRDALEQQVEQALERIATYKKEWTEQYAQVYGPIANIVEATQSCADAFVNPSADTLSSELEDARKLAEAFRIQLDQDRQRYDKEREELQEEVEHAAELYEEARAEQGRLGVTVDGLRGRLGAVEFELEKARKQLSLQMAEMDALRQEAAAQVASANIQAGEMENHIARLESALQFAREAGQHTQGDATRLHTHLKQATDTVEVLLTGLRQLEAFPLPARDALAENTAQAHLFEADLFEVLPHPPAEEGRPLPGTDAEFQSVVQNAFDSTPSSLEVSDTEVEEEQE